MEPEVLLLYSQEPAAGPYAQPENCFHALRFHLLRIHCNINFQPMPSSSKWSPSFRFSHP